MPTAHLLRPLAIAVLVMASLPLSHAQPDTTRASHTFGASRPIPGRYIVMLQTSVQDTEAATQELMRGRGGQVQRKFTRAIKGFTADLPDAAVQALRNHPLVAGVEQDHTIALAGVSSPQDQATWGLDRIDQADRPLDTRYTFSHTGAGVNAFILDTGLRADHAEFAGRVRPGYSVIADGGGTNDCHGHGTHVAGTVAGSTWGVAKQAWVVPVRVLDCAGSGSWSGVIAALDWVAASPLRPAVANLSLGGSASATLDAAVDRLVQSGVPVVVAAGNSNTDACTVSPARAPGAITVGATASSDSRAYYSNIGSCLDLFAPGTSITSAAHSSTTGSALMSGTSMAAPHVAGVAALILQANPGASVSAVTQTLLAGATPNRLTSIGTGSPNLLLYSLASGAPAVQPSAQTVAFRAMSGTASRQGGQWKATVTATVRDVITGAAVPNATVSGSFSPGGSGSCVTSSSGSCSLTSGSLKNNAAASTTFTGNGISGSLMNYDATQNSVTQIVISKP